MKLRTLYIKPMYKIKAKVYVYILICGYIAASGGRERERESIEDGVYIYNVSHINTHTHIVHAYQHLHTHTHKTSQMHIPRGIEMHRGTQARLELVEVSPQESLYTIEKHVLRTAIDMTNV